MANLPKSKQPTYRSPIRKKTSPIFVYADPINKAWLEKQLRYMSMSAFFDKILTLSRQEHPDFKGLVEDVERMPVSRRSGFKAKNASA